MEDGKRVVATEYPFMQGGGEMARLTRQFNWAATSIGPPGKWPQSLRTIVSTLLSSKFPMFVWWGDDLIQFYNDAYRPSLGNNGKHPLALGQNGKDCWPEIWTIIYPLIKQVLTTGEATWSEDQFIPIYRNGKIEDVYWTFGYSPIRNDEGDIEGVLVVCAETTEKVLTNKRLLQSEENLRNIILKAPVAMCILLGPEHIIEVANDFMIELWGKPVDDVMYKPVFDALPDAREQGLEDLLAHVYATGETFKASERPVVLLHNGRLETVYQNFVYEPYVDASGKILGVLAVSIDVTGQVIARHKIEDVVTERTKALAEANSRLEHSNAELAQFAYIASHDLQEPVRKVSMYTQMLENNLGNIDDRSRNYLNKINTSSSRMLALIKDVLAYSELSKASQGHTTVSLQQVLDEVRTDFELLTEQKQASIQVAALPQIDAIYLHMVQLFGNLVSNALKYTRPGVPPAVNISAAVLAEDEMQQYPMLAKNVLHYKIEVTDNGIGFSHEYAGQIFNIFQRLHGRKEYDGTGIGLAICQKIVQDHRGQIYATSEVGKGSTFVIILPQRQERTT